MFVYATGTGSRPGRPADRCSCLRRVFDEGGSRRRSGRSRHEGACTGWRFGFPRTRTHEAVRAAAKRLPTAPISPPVTPEHDALPLALDYFTDRFADQRWLIYDRKRDYGYYYDGASARHASRWRTTGDDRRQTCRRVACRGRAAVQLLWKSYFRALADSQRTNERLQTPHDAAPLLETPDRNGVNAGREVNSAACRGLKRPITGIRRIRAAW
ncbi:MAG: DUF4130 domain-containing protein [Alistipes shahii]|uniref:DUF4130 domain-containing protein n=1 Tax=Alistipes shahii TaxID=328814 RepID=UPI00399D3F20